MLRKETISNNYNDEIIQRRILYLEELIKRLQAQINTVSEEIKNIEVGAIDTSNLNGVLSINGTSVPSSSSDTSKNPRYAIIRNGQIPGLILDGGSSDIPADLTGITSINTITFPNSIPSNSQFTLIDSNGQIIVNSIQLGGGLLEVKTQGDNKVLCYNGHPVQLITNTI